MNFEMNFLGKSTEVSVKLLRSFSNVNKYKDGARRPQKNMEIEINSK
jgi:hypothetical protein